MNKFLIILLVILTTNNKLVAQSATLNLDFLINLTIKFNSFNIQSQLQDKQFDFIERKGFNSKYYTYLYGENYNYEEAKAYSFLKIKTKKLNDELVEIEYEGDEKAFKSFQSELQKKGFKGKSFFEDKSVKTVYKLNDLIIVFLSENDEKAGSNLKRINLIPNKSDLNFYDGLTTLIYNNYFIKEKVLNTRVTKWQDFKYVYVNEKFGNELDYTKNNLDHSNNYHVDYDIHDGKISITFLQNNNPIFSYFNTENLFVRGKFLSKELIEGEFIYMSITALPQLGDLTVNKNIVNFINGKSLLKITFKDGWLTNLTIYLPDGVVGKSMSFTKGKLD